MTAKIDPKRELRHLYSARQTPELVDVPELSFLMIDGHGDPNRSPATRPRSKRSTPSPTR